MKEIRGRINTSIFFEVYETNSAKILIHQNHQDLTFHVVEMPSNFSEFSIMLLDETMKNTYLMALTKVGVLITSIDRKMIYEYNNEFDS